MKQGVISIHLKDLKILDPKDLWILGIKDKCHNYLENNAPTEVFCFCFCFFNRAGNKKNHKTRKTREKFVKFLSGSCPFSFFSILLLIVQQSHDIIRSFILIIVLVIVVVLVSSVVVLEIIVTIQCINCHPQNLASLKFYANYIT